MHVRNGLSFAFRCMPGMLGRTQSCINTSYMRICYSDVNATQPPRRRRLFRELYEHFSLLWVLRLPAENISILFAIACECEYCVVCADMFNAIRLCVPERRVRYARCVVRVRTFSTAASTRKNTLRCVFVERTNVGILLSHFSARSVPLARAAQTPTPSTSTDASDLLFPPLVASLAADTSYRFLLDAVMLPTRAYIYTEHVLCTFVECRRQQARTHAMLWLWRLLTYRQRHEHSRNPRALPGQLSGIRLSINSSGSSCQPPPPLAPPSQRQVARLFATFRPTFHNIHNTGAQSMRAQLRAFSRRLFVVRKKDIQL